MDGVDGVDSVDGAAGPVTQDELGTRVSEGYSELHSSQEICQPASSSLPIEGTPAVNQQTKQRAGMLGADCVPSTSSTLPPQKI